MFSISEAYHGEQKSSLFYTLRVFSVVRGKLGALRLKVRLVEDRILPSVYYQPLIHLLVESVISPTEVSSIIISELIYSGLNMFITFLEGGFLVSGYHMSSND